MWIVPILVATAIYLPFGLKLTQVGTISSGLYEFDYLNYLNYFNMLIDLGF